MLTQSLNALNARRRNPSENDKGFTLIELLVVVIIIGILAAIAIPVYLGVQDNAKDSSAQSDVTNLKTAVVSMQTNLSGVLPAAADVLTSGVPTTDAAKAGASKGENTTSLSYLPGTGGEFCVSGTSNSSGASVFFATQSGGVKKVSTADPLPSGC